MKKFLVLMVMAGVLFTGCGSTPSPRAKKNNSMSIDESRTVSPMKNGVKNGVEKVYYSDGKLYSAVPYVDGKKNGTAYYYTKYHDRVNGVYGIVHHLDKTIEWKNGVEDGPCIGYYPGKKVRYRYNYKNGLEQGDLFVYSSDGKLLKKGRYLDGKKYGTWYFYDTNGNIGYTEKYDKEGKENPYKQRMQWAQHDIDQQCKYYQKGSFVFDSSGKALSRAEARIWYMNHCQKFMKK